jgi:hypothetical protein
MLLTCSVSEVLNKVIAKVDIQFIKGFIKKGQHQESLSWFFLASIPPLGIIASVAEEMMQGVFLHCGLIMFCQGSGHSVLMQQWQSFKLEYQLSETEVTHFTIIT